MSPDFGELSSTRLGVDYVEERFYLAPEDTGFSVGRSGDLLVDDNPFLHRHVLVLAHEVGLWWVINTGTRISLTLSAGAGALHSWVAPGHRVPLVLPLTTVIFSAGDTTYELGLTVDTPVLQTSSPPQPDGDLTLGTVELSHGQLLTVLALAEPTLRQRGKGMSELPSNGDAAKRLHIPVTAFNRRLDSVCEKLDRAGVRGLRGRPGELATSRRARVVEHAVASGIVRLEHLAMLDSAFLATQERR